MEGYEALFFIGVALIMGFLIGLNIGMGYALRKLRESLHK